MGRTRMKSFHHRSSSMAEDFRPSARSRATISPKTDTRSWRRHVDTAVFEMQIDPLLMLRCGQRDGPVVLLDCGAEHLADVEQEAVVNLEDRHSRRTGSKAIAARAIRIVHRRAAPGGGGRST